MRDPLLKLLHTTPIFKLLLPLVAGIVIAKGITIPAWTLILIALISLVLAIFLTYQKSLYNPAWYLSMCILFFVVGAGIYKLHDTAASEYDRLKPSKQFVGVITSIAEPVAYGQRYEMKIILYRNNTSWKPCNANILLYVKKQVGLSATPGQYVLLNNVSLRLQSKAPFPYCKSQSEFYFQQNISGLISIDQSNKIYVLPYQRKNWLYRIQQIRELVLRQTNKYFASASERAIFQSLFFGYRAEMDSELTNAYATAGVIHILSVSGLHVGIIYLFFIFLTSPLKQHYILRIFRTLLVISAIWFYGLLTGYSPPVIRSCSMFTILGLAQLLQRESFSFNSLFLSAFIILLFAPHQLFNVGFQLSYAAMAGIFLFYQPFSQVMQSKNFLGKHITELIAVSLAAQLGTLPFTLYYFNSFPLYFLIANLVIVPLATLIMYTGIIFLALLPIGSVVTHAAQLLSSLITWLNKIVIWIEQLPYASLKGFYPNLFQTIILAGTILTLAYIIYYRNLKFFPLLLSLIVMFQIAEVIKYFRGYFNQQVIIVTNYPAGFVCYQHHNQLICISKDEPPKYVKRYFDNYRKYYYFREIKTIHLKDITPASKHASYKIRLKNLTLSLTYPVNPIIFHQNTPTGETKHIVLPPDVMLTIDGLAHQSKQAKTMLTENGYFLIKLN